MRRLVLALIAIVGLLASPAGAGAHADCHAEAPMAQSLAATAAVVMGSTDPGCGAHEQGVRPHRSTDCVALCALAAALPSAPELFVAPKTELPVLERSPVRTTHPPEGLERPPKSIA